MKTLNPIHATLVPRRALALAAMLAAAASPAFAQSAAEPPKVPVVQPKAEAVSNYVELTGNAAPIDAVKLVARVEGYLQSQNYQDGALVKKGDLLFVVQQDQYQAQLTQARSQVMAATASLNYADIEVKRYKALVKKDAAAQTDVDHWVYEHEAAQASLLNAQAQVAIAQLNLGYTEIRAPFDGQMSKRLIDPGNLVGAAGQQGSPLAEILQLDPIYVVATLSEQNVLQIRQNLNQMRLSLAQLTKVPVDVALENETDYPRHGTLEYVSPGLDPATGTVLVRAKLANPNHDLLPGFFVRMRLPTQRGKENALLVPDRAMQEDQGGRYVLVVNKDNTVEKKYVQLGELFNGLREVTKGIAADDRVIVGELWRVNVGMKVTPQAADARQ